MDALILYCARAPASVMLNPMSPTHPALGHPLIVVMMASA